MTSEQFEKWVRDNNIFVSKVIKKLTFSNFTGIYILNSYKLNWFPKFFGMKGKYYIQCGVNWLGYIIEFQYSR